MTSQNKKNKHKRSFSVNATLKNKISKCKCKGFLFFTSSDRRDNKKICKVMDIEEKYGFTPATDGEMQGFEYTIPDGFTAEIKDGKVIVKKQESEDERIRKFLFELLSHCYWRKEWLFSSAECLAWLEKQKDASKAIEAVDRIDKYIDENVANAHDMKDSNPDKKYYRGWDDALSKMAGILQDVYSDEKQKEQKPAEWSEDNIKELTEFEAVMLHIGMSFFGGTAGLNPNNTNEVKEQAKLLLELAPKQEWSEEDELFLNVCKNALQKYQTSDKWDASIISKWLEEKLKSL